MTSTHDPKEFGESFVNTCRFCGKTTAEVRTLMVSPESAICDECIVAGLETISRRPGQFHIRIAFLIFRAVASLGRFLSFQLTK